MNSNNLAQKTNFNAGSNQLQLSQIYLNSVNIPGINFSHPELSSRAGSKLNLTGDTLTYNNLSIEILVDEDFNIYHEISTKIFNNISPITGSFANIEFDFWIDINNSKGYHLFKMEFNSCRIESIGDIQLETNSDETEFTLPVELKFDYFNIIKSNVAPTLQVK